MTTPYELRYKVLADAQNILMAQYHNQTDTERSRAHTENRQPVDIPLPTAKSIVQLAEELYVFVKTKD